MSQGERAEDLLAKAQARQGTSMKWQDKRSFPWIPWYLVQTLSRPEQSYYFWVGLDIDRTLDIFRSYLSDLDVLS